MQGIVENDYHASGEKVKNGTEKRGPGKRGADAEISNPVPAEVAPVLIAGRTSAVVLGDVVFAIQGEDTITRINRGVGAIFGVAVYYFAKQRLDADPGPGKGCLEPCEVRCAQDTLACEGAEEVNSQRRVKSDLCIAGCNVSQWGEGRAQKKTYGDRNFERLFSWTSK